MIREVWLLGEDPKQRAGTHDMARALRSEFGTDAISVAPESVATHSSVRLDEWRKCGDLLGYDRLIHALETTGDFGLTLMVRDVCAEAPAASQVLTRYQRLLPLPAAAKAFAELSTCLDAHRALHRLELPLVRADYDHAIDTWRWVLRLEPRASRAVQLAALFHDVERLESEPVARVEQQAPDYLAFKLRHAARGARIAQMVLTAAGLEAACVDDVARLVEHHEQPGDDAELQLLNDADALSFFSLNSWGYLKYFGLEQTRKKVSYTVSRMRYAALQLALATRQPPQIACLLTEHGARAAAAV